MALPSFVSLPQRSALSQVVKIRFPARDSAKDKSEKPKGDSKSQRMVWSHAVSLAEDDLQTAVTTLRLHWQAVR